MIGGSLRTRLSLTGAVLVAAGLGTALALGAGNDAGPPSIDADSGTALFTLDGMLPGDPPVERCVAIQAIGGSASRLAVSAAVGGVLAHDLSMEVVAGQGPAPGDAHSCAGFVPERELWSGTLAGFPKAGAPAVDDAPLLSGGSRVYRFRVEFPKDATGTAGARATQDSGGRRSSSRRPRSRSQERAKPTAAAHRSWATSRGGLSWWPGRA